MKHLLVIVAVCLTLSLTGLAQSGDEAPATREDIQRYMDVMHSRDLMQQMLVARAELMHQMVHDQYLKDKDKLPPDFEDRMNKLMDGMFRDMPFDEMTQAMIPAYQKHLTRGNVSDLVAFYSSPTGQKLLRELPSMTADAMQSAMPVIRNYMEKVRGRVEQQIAELKKASPKKPVQVPDSLKN